MIAFSVSAEALDTAALRGMLHDPAHGGFCAFEGWVRNRNEGRPVDALEYEVYEALALAEGERIAAEARQRFGEVSVLAVHRSGLLRVGELAVWVGVSSPHRDEAFRACRYVIDQIKHRLPVWKKEHYLDGDTAWVACAHPGHDDDEAPHGHAHPPAAPTATTIAADFVPDYSRQTRLREVGQAGQARLAAARVLVIGAGGLGSPVLAYLAGAGVGHLGIVDPDRVEASNLHRQTLYGVGDIGEPKVRAAARRLTAVNPHLDLTLYDQILTPADIVEVVAGYDLVVECSDDPHSRYLANDAALVAGVPLVLASVYQYEGQLQVVSAQPGQPCLRCLWPDEPAPGASGSCVESGVLGPVPGVLGAMQANEALKLLLDLPRAAADALTLVDLLDNRSQRLPIDAARGCACRGGCVAVARVALARATATMGKDLLELAFPDLDQALAAGYRLIDLRQAAEIQADPLPQSSLWLPSAQLAERLADLPAAEPLLLVCASGKRSTEAVRWLRSRGFDHTWSLRGGLAMLQHDRLGQTSPGAPGMASRASRR